MSAKSNERIDKLLEYIAWYQEVYAVTPSRRDMGGHLGISTGMVNFYLDLAQDRGLILIEKKVARAVHFPNSVIAVWSDNTKIPNLHASILVLCGVLDLPLPGTFYDEGTLNRKLWVMNSHHGRIEWEDVRLWINAANIIPKEFRVKSL